MQSNTVTSTRFSTQARTFILLAGLTALLLAIGVMLGGRGGLIIAGILAIGMNFFSYWFSDKMAIRGAGAQPLSEQDDPQLFAMTRRLAERAGVPMPRLFVIPSHQPNAFATGRNPEHAAIAVTVGLRELMPPDEVEAVLAHEFGHIVNRDILIQSIGAMIAGTISFLGQMMFFMGGAFGGDDDNPNPLSMIGGLLMLILGPIAATILQLAISRQREYRADATAAELMGRPEPLANALERLEQGIQQLPMRVNPASEPLYIVNPLKGGGLASLFATHPPIAERVARLRAMLVV